jgi:hypothetical protein
MDEPNSTKLNIREDRPTALSSTVHGANLDAVGFNIEFLAKRNPHLVIELLRLYTDAHRIRENDPKPPEEDYALLGNEIAKFRASVSDEEM